MKDTYSIPVAAFKIGNLSGSDLEVVTVIHVEWPNRVHCRKLGPTLTLRDVLRGDRNSRLRGPLPMRSAQPVDGVRTSKIGHRNWKAIFPAIWSSVIGNSTPLSACSVMPWMTFLPVRDGFDWGGECSTAPELHISAPRLPTLVDLEQISPWPFVRHPRLIQSFQNVSRSICALAPVARLLAMSLFPPSGI